MVRQPWRLRPHINGGTARVRGDRGPFFSLCKSTGTPALAASQEQVHKDDLHPVDMDGSLDDLLPIQGNGQWHLKLIEEPQVEEAPAHPDWFGYWRI